MADYSEMLQEMKGVRERVNTLMLKLLPLSHEIPEIDLLYRMLRDYPERPGKGMRPYICVTSCRAFGGSEDDALLTAASIELFQNWILIHDDIEDHSEMRRGSAALHKKYEMELALNAGDALHARMWGVLLQNRERLGERSLDVLEEFTRMINETTEGQHMELGWVLRNRWDITEEDYVRMCIKKTSWYTVISPLRLGGIVAGADQAAMAPLLEAGEKLGVGFQIHDDVLNLTAGEKYGKESADDLLEGKRTLMLIRTLSLCSAEEKKRVADLFRMARDKRRDHLGELLRLIKEKGAIEYANAKATRLLDEALALMRSTPWSGSEEAVRRLEEIARFAVERDW